MLLLKKKINVKLIIQSLKVNLYSIRKKYKMKKYTSKTMDYDGTLSSGLE